MEGRKIWSVVSILALTVAGLAVAARAESAGRVAPDMPQMGPAIAAVTPAAVLPPAAVGTSATPAVTPTAGKSDAATPVTPVAGGTVVAPEAAPEQAPVKASEPPVIKQIETTAIRPSAEETAAAAAADGGAAKKPVSNSMSVLTSTLQVAGALAVVLGIVLIGRVLMKKFVPGAAVGNGKGVLETLARYPVGRNQSVVLLRIGSQIVALNQTKDASQSILVISEPMEVAKIMGQIAGSDPNSIQTNFNRALSNARMDLENPSEMSAEMPDGMDVMDANRAVGGEDDLDQQLEEMAAAKRQLMELRAQVRSVRDNLPA